MNTKRNDASPPINSNETNVREHGVKNLDKIERVLSTVFDSYTPIDVYTEIKNDIETGPYDQVYKRIDVFSKLYISMTGIKKKLGVCPENLTRDKNQKHKASGNTWNLIEKAYWDGELKPYLKDITEALKGFLITKEN